MRASVRRGAVFAALVLSCSLIAGCGSADSRSWAHIRRGERFFADGNLPKAQIEFRNAMQIAPRRADARVLAGQVYERLGNLRDALALYQSALDLDSESLPARTDLARLEVFAGQPRRALELLDPALRRHPDDPELLTARAAARVGLKDSAGAMADGQRAWKLAPQNEDVVALLAALYGNAGRLQQAADVILSALPAHPASADLHRILADLYVKLGRNELAEAQFIKLVALEPNTLTARYQLASFYSRAGRLMDAERVLRETIAARPNDDGPRLTLAELLAEHSLAEGEKTLAGFIAERPDDYDLQLALGGLLQRASEPQRALEAYRNVVARAGERPQALAARDAMAGMLVDQQRLDEASMLVAQVLATNAHDSIALRLRAAIALERGEPAPAITDLRAVLRDQPNSASIMHSLARAYLADGETTLAEEMLRNALEAAPSDAGVRVDLAQLLAQTHRVDEGISLLESSARGLPSDVTVREALIRAYLSQGNLAAAAKAAQDYAKSTPQDWRGPYLEGLVADAHRSSQDARHRYEQALALRADATEALAALTRIDVASGQITRAISRVETVVAAEPNDSATRSLLGELYLTAKDMPRATAQLSRSIQLKPNWWLPYRDLAATRLAMGDTAGAIQTYQQGIAATHMAAPLVLELAALYTHLARPDEAIDAYDSLHREFPGLAVASNNLAMLLVTYRKDRASLERARDLTVAFLTASDPRLLDTAGWVLLKYGDLARALPALEEACRRAPASRVIRYHLGMAQLDSGERERARASLKAAVAGSTQFEGSEDARSVLARIGS